jgi:hypothetical protein
MAASANDFVGDWRQIEPDPRPESIFIAFEADGHLRYSVEAETVQHILLTWRIAGDALVTDQPSSPRQERTRFRFITSSRLLLERQGESYTYERC